jgi:ParB family chromosome partitioning protein
MSRRPAQPRSSRRPDAAAPAATTVQQIPLDRIDLPRRPARRFLGDIAALAESMQDYGLQQPISVRADGERFILTSGMRRLAAARMLRWSTIPGFVRSVSADDAYLLDLIENLQREDLSAEEEADAFGELIRTRGWTLQQVADSVKRSVAYISKRVRVFEDQQLRHAIVSQGLPVSTAEELLAAEPEQRSALIQRALDEHWDQVRAREALRAAQQPPTAPAEADFVDFDDDEEEDDDERRLRAERARDHAAYVEPVRPRGFTRAVREFHRLLLGIRAEDLTQADRAALRALFRDLLLLARAPATPGQRTFPPLPSNPAPGNERRVRSRTKTTRR